MTHDEIEQGDVIERYVGGSLAPEARRAFEEHYFACDECFAAVQQIEALRGAVRAGTDEGWLATASAPAAAPRPSLMSWLPIAASIALAGGVAWLTLVQMPALKNQIAAASAERDTAQKQLEQASSALADARTQGRDTVEANVPVAIVASERGAAETQTLTLAAETAHFVVMIDAPASPSGRAGLVITSSDAAVVLTVDNLVRNSSGVWAASLPASKFPSGTYRLRLTAATTNLGEFLLRIVR